MSFLRHQGLSRGPRRRGFLTQKCCVGLWCSAVAAIVLAHQHLGFRSDLGLDTKGWSMADLLAHLQTRGVKLHVVPSDRNGCALEQAVYLTEDPDATWLSMLAKMRIAERAHQWRGTVWVGHARHSIYQDEELAEMGEHGCRIGDFIFFGDRRILGRIQEACR